MVFFAGPCRARGTMDEFEDFAGEEMLRLAFAGLDCVLRHDGCDVL